MVKIFHTLPSLIATDMVEYFTVPMDHMGHDKRRLSLRAFIDQHHEPEVKKDVFSLVKIVTKLTNKGVLCVATEGSILDREYLAMEYPGKDYRKYYGAYDYMVGGPSSIHASLKDSVVPVLVKTIHDNPDIGTGFLLNDGHILCTARHNIENHKRVEIRDSNGKIHTPDEVVFPKDDTVDLAFLVYKNDPFFQKSFLLNKPQVTEDVLVMGFPPVPGFDSILVVETGEVCSQLKTTAGQMVGSGNSYLDKQTYYLINSKVKGGSSGAPVINERGHAVGMICSTSLSPEKSNEFSGMGYGLALPGVLIIDLLNSVKTDRGLCKSASFNVLDDGTISTLNTNA